MRIVLDTNILVSFLFWPKQPLHERVKRLLKENTVLRSTDTYSELAEVVLRRKFDAYMRTAQRELFLAGYFDRTEHVLITRRVDACRDERDNMFLELAICGKADLLVTGDDDLLALDPFEGIRIIDLRKFA